MNVSFKLEGLNVKLPGEGQINIEQLAISTDMSEEEFASYIATLTNLLKTLEQ